MHTFIVLNPVAGQSQPQRVRLALQDRFGTIGEGSDLHIYETTGREELGEVVSNALARGAKRVFVAGGDGTVSGVAGGLAGSGVALGIIPTGSGNALARDLDIPLEVEAACDLLAGKHEARAVDALKVGERRFLVRIGVGFDASVVDMTERTDKRRAGALAYVMRAAEKMQEVRAYAVRLQVDGKTYHSRAVQVILANGATWGMPGLGLRLGRDVRPDDGRIEVCIFLGDSFAEHARQLLAILRGRTRPVREIRVLDAYQEITIRTPGRAIPVHGDGEPLGTTPVTATVVPGAVKVIVPR